KIVNDHNMRVVQDILLLCSDNLPCLEKAVEAVFPQSIRQICIVHQFRNSLKFVSYKDRKAIIRDIKAIYQADNQQQSQEALNVFKSKWKGKYDKAIDS